MWEVEGHYQPLVDGPVGTLSTPLEHRDDKPLAAWIARHNRYSDWAARMEEDGRLDGLSAHEPRIRRLLKAVVRRTPLRAPLAFVWSYIVRLGLLDGASGLHWALANAYYQWQIQAKRRDLRRDRQNLHRPGLT